MTKVLEEEEVEDSVDDEEEDATGTMKHSLEMGSDTIKIL